MLSLPTKANMKTRNTLLGIKEDVRPGIIWKRKKVKRALNENSLSSNLGLSVPFHYKSVLNWVINYVITLFRRKFK
jgi:hypothetical protein